MESSSEFNTSLSILLQIACLWATPEYAHVWNDNSTNSAHLYKSTKASILYLKETGKSCFQIQIKMFFSWLKKMHVSAGSHQELEPYHQFLFHIHNNPWTTVVSYFYWKMLIDLNKKLNILPVQYSMWLSSIFFLIDYAIKYKTYPYNFNTHHSLWKKLIFITVQTYICIFTQRCQSTSVNSSARTAFPQMRRECARSKSGSWYLLYTKMKLESLSHSVECDYMFWENVIKNGRT